MQTITCTITGLAVALDEPGHDITDIASAAAGIGTIEAANAQNPPEYRLIAAQIAAGLISAKPSTADDYLQAALDGINAATTTARDIHKQMQRLHHIAQAIAQRIRS